MVQARRRARRPQEQPAPPADVGGARLNDLRRTAAEIIEQTLARSPDLAERELKAEAERVRSLYAPLLQELVERAGAAETLEELDQIMWRQARIGHLLDEEWQWLASRQAER